MDYNNHVSDNLDRRGFINKEIILEYVTQEQVFELVLGFIPEEFQYITSPLRIDRNPGCWFEYHVNGVLYLIDFGGHRKHSDCFNLVQDYFKIPNFYLTLEFIFNKMIKGKNIEAENKITPTIVKSTKLPVRILIETRQWEKRDGKFWSPYEITKENLIEDKVFAIRRYHLLNTKSGSFSKTVYDATYAFTDFPEQRKKLYFPYREHDSRFISTCVRNDIGGMSSLPAYGRHLIITKSYKDWRVLKNQGKNVVWLQNEGMKPDIAELVILCQRFREVVVWFDNDAAGILAAQEISNLINNTLSRRARPMWLPEDLLEKKIKDPSDLLQKKGRKELLTFINYRI